MKGKETWSVRNTIIQIHVLIINLGAFLRLLIKYVPV